MSEHSFTRREVLSLGARLAGATFLGTILPPETLMGEEPQKSVSVFDVLEYGAKGNGSTLDTRAIQKTIDAAAAKGHGSRVMIPGGHQFLIATITLKSNIDFHIAKGAELIISSRREDYSDGGKSVIIADGAVNLKISGSGHINGQALKFMSHLGMHLTGD
jgi:polygalacturonase